MEFVDSHALHAPRARGARPSPYICAHAMRMRMRRMWPPTIKTGQVRLVKYLKYEFYIGVGQKKLPNWPA